MVNPHSCLYQDCNTVLTVVGRDGPVADGQADISYASPRKMSAADPLQLETSKNRQSNEAAHYLYKVWWNKPVAVRQI